MIIYIGVIKIDKPVLSPYEEWVKIEDPDSGQLVGYINPEWNHTTLSYNIDHLSPITQALIRGKKNQTAMIVFDSGESWFGKAYYSIDKNSLYADIAL